MVKMSHRILALVAMTLIAASVQAQNTHPGERDPDGTWRFHMVQNGKVMTADDFSAWMAQRGLAIQNGRSINTMNTTNTARQVSFHQTQGMALHTSPPAAMTQQASWQPAIEPITTAPERRPRLDEGGRLMGYDSSWDSGQYPTSGYSSGHHQGSFGSNTTLMSYDSGRDY